jgi:hypothetical protein
MAPVHHGLSMVPYIMVYPWSIHGSLTSWFIDGLFMVPLISWFIHGSFYIMVYSWSLSHHGLLMVSHIMTYPWFFSSHGSSHIMVPLTSWFLSHHGSSHIMVPLTSWFLSHHGLSSWSYIMVAHHGPLMVHIQSL